MDTTPAPPVLLRMNRILTRLRIEEAQRRMRRSVVGTATVQCVTGETVTLASSDLEAMQAVGLPTDCWEWRDGSLLERGVYFPGPVVIGPHVSGQVVRYIVRHEHQDHLRFNDGNYLNWLPGNIRVVRNQKQRDSFTNQPQEPHTMTVSRRRRLHDGDWPTAQPTKRHVEGPYFSRIPRSQDTTAQHQALARRIEEATEQQEAYLAEQADSLSAATTTTTTTNP